MINKLLSLVQGEDETVLDFSMRVSSVVIELGNTRVTPTIKVCVANAELKIVGFLCGVWPEFRETSTQLLTAKTLTWEVVVSDIWTNKSLCLEHPSSSSIISGNHTSTSSSCSLPSSKLSTSLSKSSYTSSSCSSPPSQLSLSSNNRHWCLIHKSGGHNTQDCNQLNDYMCDKESTITSI